MILTVIYEFKKPKKLYLYIFIKSAQFQLVCDVIVVVVAGSKKIEKRSRGTNAERAKSINGLAL